jgi:hypothetical protein
MPIDYKVCIYCEGTRPQPEESCAICFSEFHKRCRELAEGHACTDLRDRGRGEN